MPGTWLRRHFSPTLLSGLTFRDWFILLKDNQFDIDAANIPRLLAVTAVSLNNSLFRAVEDWRFRDKVETIDLPPPLFIIGSARSGTTLLYNFMTRDRRFAFPNLFEVQFPHIFLTMESFLGPVFRRFLPKRRILDDVRVSLDVPGEDEFAIAFMSLCSPYLGLSFPRRKAGYARFLNMENVSEEESRRWNQALEYFAKKLTFKYRRPLILKSPPHFCRVRRLLQLFPQARFVHIHRHPFSVMQSKFHAMNRVYAEWSLQSSETLDEAAHLLQHKQICERFISEKHVIPQGQFHEISYENFVRDPIKELCDIYHALELPDFSVAEPSFQDYRSSVSGYRTNQHEELSSESKEQIYKTCRVLFDQWGYDYDPPGRQVSTA